MANFEKVRTGHKRWTAQWSAVRAHTCTLADFGMGQSREGLGAWPIAFDVGPSQTLSCSRVQFSAPTSRPAFGRVIASRVMNW